LISSAISPTIDGSHRRQSEQAVGAVCARLSVNRPDSAENAR
jgi:hypothetical protein